MDAEALQAQLLRQNYKHLKALEATLGIAPEHLHSVITFVGGSTFKTTMPANVTEGIGFIRYIKSFQQPVFSRRNDPDAERQCPKYGNALVSRTKRWRNYSLSFFDQEIFFKYPHIPTQLNNHSRTVHTRRIYYANPERSTI